MTLASHLSRALTMREWLLTLFRNVWWLLNVSFNSKQIEGFWVKQHCTPRPSQVQTADPVVSDQLYNFWRHRNGAAALNWDNARSLWTERTAAQKSDCHSAITLCDSGKRSSPQSRAWHSLSLSLVLSVSLSPGTCIADYHLLSRLKDMPNHHQSSSSLHFCLAGMLLSDTEKHLRAANRILKTSVL